MLLFKYEPIIECLDQELFEKDLVRAVTILCKGTSLYPMHYCIDMIRNDIRFLENINHYKSCDNAYTLCLRILLKMLENIDELILGTTAYVEEKRIQQEREHQLKLERTAERQMCAQERQAQALEERNRIERKKNRE